MPEPSRLHLPEGYGAFEPFTLETAPSWDDFEPALESSRNYWVVVNGTSSPVVAPVWGVWMDQEFIFSTDPSSRKARALAASPRCIVHLESGDDVVIVHGDADRFTGDGLDPFLEAYERKYGIAIDPDNLEQAIFRIVPVFALTWLERDFLATATRWEF